MTEETLVAVFDTKAQAKAALADLMREGLPADAIERHAQAAFSAGQGPTTTSDGQGFWRYLFGGETSDDQNRVYDRIARSGGEVMTVVLSNFERDADHIMALLERHGPVNVGERAASYNLSAPAGDITATGEELLQLSEERLAVSKRDVDRGATRLRRFVQIKPVEQNVTLREEHVLVERRTATDTKVRSNAFLDEVIEMTEINEVAIITKQARVREEIVLQKTVVDRVEIIHENLRSEQVEVQQVTDTSTVRDPSRNRP